MRLDFEITHNSKRCNVYTPDDRQQPPFERRDTDCFVLATAMPTLEECERKDLRDDARRNLRFALFGSETTYNFGKVKLEFASDSFTCMGPKCYFATNRDDDVEVVSTVKMKGCQTAKMLKLDELRAAGGRTVLLRERAPRIRRSAFGVGGFSAEAREIFFPLMIEYCRRTWSPRRNCCSPSVLLS